MSDQLIRFGPLGSILALVAWCCWPYVTGPDGAPQLGDHNKLPRITRAMTSPQFHAKVARDPFVPLSIAAKVKEEMPALLSAPRQLVSAAFEPPPIDPLQALSSLKLNATSVCGGRPMALIDGVLHEPGDRLTLDKYELTCTVRQIVHDKVVVEHDGQLFALAYPAAADLAAADYGKTAVSRVGGETNAAPSLWELIKHQLSKTN